MLFLIVRAKRRKAKQEQSEELFVKKLPIKKSKENQTLTELIEEKLKAKITATNRLNGNVFCFAKN